MVYTKKNNMNVIISAKTYKIECINETIEKNNQKQQNICLTLRIHKIYYF